MSLPRIIGLRRFLADAAKLGLPLAALAALVILAGNGPPSVTARTYTIEPVRLDQGGIWEQWKIDIPRQEPGLTAVTLRVRGRISAQWLKFENLSTQPETITGDPFGFIWAEVPWIVDAPGMPLRSDDSMLVVQTEPVARDYDGQWDYGGESGTQITHTPYAATSGHEMPVLDVSEWEGRGVVTVTVTAPSTRITVGAIHTIEQATSAGVFGDGWVVVEFER